MPKKLSSLLKAKSSYNVAGSLWIEYENHRCFGPGRMQLLQAINNTGSINKAAKEMKMSYKKAWTMINELNTQFNEPMVITQSGGDGGGGSVITNAAKTLMKYHDDMRQRFLQFLASEKVRLTE